MTDWAALSIDAERFERLLELAVAEDLGRAGDVTSNICALPAEGTAVLRVRDAGVICGLPLIPNVLAAFDARLAYTPVDGVDDGSAVAAGTPLGALRGPVADMLACERTLLNFIQRLCGIATLTARFVDAVAGTAAAIYDTRKTTPGWRDLEKYAVRCGGGHNHRHGLHDAVLIKDNHIAGTAPGRLAHTLFEALNEASALSPAPEFIEVEVDDRDQLEEVFKVIGIDIVLLDNFNLDDLRAAVARRDELNLRGRVALEASGGITLETTRAVAETGVDRIAVGALTHSAVALDVGLDIE